MPSRLVRLDLQFGELVAHLLPTELFPEKVVYVTLSHLRAASDGVLRLEKRNEYAFQHNIPVYALSPVMNQAMLTVKSMNVDYIWIDSLCILQDDEDDRAQENRKMEAIYQSALCNIAASTPDNPQSGIFNLRDFPCFVPLCTMVTRPLDPEHEPDPTNSGFAYLLVDEHLWEQGVEKTPLMKSAWAIVERTLSSRTIHFGRFQVFWECNELRACETFPDGIPTFMACQSISLRKESPLYVMQRNPKLPAGATKRPDVLDQECIGAWWKVVKAFTAVALTIPGDRYVAIGALARAMQPRLKRWNNYHAGFWNLRFVEQLLWTTRPGVTNLGPFIECIGPSWSWASFSCPIEPCPWVVIYTKLYDEYCVPMTFTKFRNMKLRYAKSMGLLDQFGLVTEGRLLLEGPLVVVKTSNGPVMAGADFDSTFIMNYDHLLQPIFQIIRLHPDLDDHDTITSVVLMKNLVQSLQYWVLVPICRNRKHTDELMGLILTPAMNGRKGEYVRKGVWTCVATYADYLDKGTKGLPTDLWNQVVDGGKYVFTIV